MLFQYTTRVRSYDLYYYINNGARLTDSSIRLEERNCLDSKSFAIAVLHRESLESGITSTKHRIECEGTLKIDLSRFGVTSILFFKIAVAKIVVIIQLINCR